MQQSRLFTHELLSVLASFCLMATSIILLYWRNGLLLAALVIQAAFSLRRWSEPLDHISFWVIAGVGTVAEVVFVQVGIWRYANPTVLGIPLWFPVSFGIAGLTGLRLTRTVAGLWTGRHARGVEEPQGTVAGMGSAASGQRPRTPGD